MYNMMLLSETVTTPSGMDAMLGVMNQVIEFAMKCFSTVTSNPILAFIFAGSLIGVGIGVFRRFKSAAR